MHIIIILHLHRICLTIFEHLHCRYDIFFFLLTTSFKSPLITVKLLGLSREISKNIHETKERARCSEHSTFTIESFCFTECVQFKFAINRDKGFVHRKRLVARAVTSERHAMKSPVAIRSKVLGHWETTE